MLLFLSFTVVSVSSLVCKQGGVDVLSPNSGPDFPSNINDTYFTPNINCTFRLQKQAGKYLQLAVSSNISATDSLVITDSGVAGMNIRYRTEDSNNAFYTPGDVQISLNAKNSGSFRVTFYYLNYTNNAPVKRTIVPGGTGAFLRSEQLYTNYAVITCNSSLTIQAQVYPLAGLATKYAMYSGFIFAGEGTSGTYLGSLYAAQQGQYLLYSTPPYTITVVSATLYDYGIALVKAYSDVVNYNVYLDYALSSSLGTSFPLDGRNKPAAITLFNPSENTTDFYLNSAKFTGFGNGVPSVLWQTGDLRPSLKVVTDYYANNTLGLLPQSLSGRLNTFIVRNDIAQLGFTFDKSPTAFLHVPSGTSTYFTSKNFPFIGGQQSHVVVYGTDYLRARMNVTVNQPTANSEFTVTFFQAGNPVAFTQTMKPFDSMSFIGNQFVFNYPATTTNAGCAAFVTFEDAGHIPPKNDTGTVTTTTRKPKFSQHLGASLFVLIFCSVAIL